MHFNFEFRLWFVTLSIFRFDPSMLERVNFSFGIGSLLPDGKRVTVRWTEVHGGLGLMRWQVGLRTWGFGGPIERVR